MMIDFIFGHIDEGNSLLIVVLFDEFVDHCNPERYLRWEQFDSKFHSLGELRCLFVDLESLLEFHHSFKQNNIFSFYESIPVDKSGCVLSLILVFVQLSILEDSIV